MKHLAVTQRVDIIANYGERRDALDQNWHAFLGTAGFIAHPLPNNPDYARTLLSHGNFDGIVLTGGNDLAAYGGDAPERDATEKLVLEFAIEQHLPLMGVCRGLQFIQSYFGATLVPVENHVAVRHAVEYGDYSSVVNSFHNYGTHDTPAELETLAVVDDGTIEAVQHRSHPVHGIMWHPEREAPFADSDIELFKTFFGA